MMSEKMQIDVDLNTRQAVENALRLIKSMDDLQAKVDRANASTVKFEGGLGSTGKSAGDAAAKVKSLSTATSDLDSDMSRASASTRKATAELSTMKGTTDPLGASFKSLSGFAASFGVSLSLFASGLKLMEMIRREAEQVIALRDRMINDRVGVESQIQGFVANLGLPNTAAGQNQVRQVLSDLKAKAPAASIPVVTSVAGQVQSIFGAMGPKFDVTKPGLGQDLSALMSGYAASSQLSEDEAGSLPLVLKNFGATDVPSAKRILAQIKAAQRTTGIKNQTEFTKQFLRLGAQFAPQGMSIDQVAGLLGASALGATDARVVGTNAEQAMRAVMGKSEDAQAFLGQRALASGILKPSDIAAAAKLTPDTPAARDLAQSIARQREDLADAEADDKRLRAIRPAEQRLRSDRVATAKTTAARDAAALEERRYREEQDRAERERREQIERRRQELKDAQDKQNASTTARAYRGLGAGTRLDAVRNSLRGMTQSQRSEYFDRIGATQEEVGALTVLGTADDAFASASAAVTSVGKSAISGIDADIKGFESSDLGKTQASNDRVALREARSIGPEEVEAKLFEEASDSRANIIIKDWEKMSDAERDATRLRGTTNDRSRLVIFSRDVKTAIYRFWSGMSAEEREAYSSLPSLIEAADNAADGFSLSRGRAELQSIYRKFVRIAALVQRDRERGRFHSRTAAKAGTLYGRLQSGYQRLLIGPEALEPISDESLTNSPIDSFAPVTPPAEEQAHPTTQPTTQPVSMTNYNVHIGNAWMSPQQGVESIGRLEGIA